VKSGGENRRKVSKKRVGDQCKGKRRETKKNCEREPVLPVEIGSDNGHGGGENFERHTQLFILGIQGNKNPDHKPGLGGKH